MYVFIQYRKRLVIPDLNGNNRLDSIRNIIEHPRAGLLFLVGAVAATWGIDMAYWVAAAAAGLATAFAVLLAKAWGGGRIAR